MSSFEPSGFSVDQKIQHIFNQTFLKKYNTRLVGGCQEPFYQAFRNDKPAVIFYREDYASSALHEVAHWCIAGRARRAQDDYGYWYHEDGRDAKQQAEFEQVEVKPQALESIFSLASGIKFKISVDNLTNGNDSSHHFRDCVKDQALKYLSTGMPGRAEAFLDALVLGFGLRSEPSLDQLLAMEFVA